MKKFLRTIKTFDKLDTSIRSFRIRRLVRRGFKMAAEGLSGQVEYMFSEAWRLTRPKPELKQSVLFPAFLDSLKNTPFDHPDSDLLACLMLPGSYRLLRDRVEDGRPLTFGYSAFIGEVYQTGIEKCLKSAKDHQDSHSFTKAAWAWDVLEKAVFSEYQIMPRADHTYLNSEYCDALQTKQRVFDLGVEIAYAPSALSPDPDWPGKPMSARVMSAIENLLARQPDLDPTRLRQSILNCWPDRPLNKNEISMLGMMANRAAKNKDVISAEKITVLASRAVDYRENDGANLGARIWTDGRAVQSCRLDILQAASPAILFLATSEQRPPFPTPLHVLDKALDLLDSSNLKSTGWTGERFDWLMGLVASDPVKEQLKQKAGKQNSYGPVDERGYHEKIYDLACNSICSMGDTADSIDSRPSKNAYDVTRVYPEGSSSVDSGLFKRVYELGVSLGQDTGNLIAPGVEKEIPLSLLDDLVEGKPALHQKMLESLMERFKKNPTAINAFQVALRLQEPGTPFVSQEMVITNLPGSQQPVVVFGGSSGRQSFFSSANRYHLGPVNLADALVRQDANPGLAGLFGTLSRREELPTLRQLVKAYRENLTAG